MKKLFIIIVTALSCYLSNAQSAEFLKGKESHQVPVPASKEMIWTTVNLWIAEEFNSPRNVIQMEDKESGMLVIGFNGKEHSINQKYISYRPQIKMQINVSDSLCVMKFIGIYCRVDQSYESLINSGGFGEIKQLKKLKAVSEECFNSSLTWEFNETNEAKDKYKNLVDSGKKAYKINYEIVEDAYFLMALEVANIFTSLENILKSIDSN